MGWEQKGLREYSLGMGRDRNHLQGVSRDTLLRGSRREFAGQRSWKGGQRMLSDI